MVYNTWGASSDQWDDGCQYTIEEADDFDATAALAVLNDVFHPSYTVTYVVKDADNNTIFTSDPVGTALGATITTLPAEYQRAFCSYNDVNVTISDVSTTVEFTATYNLPFTLSPSYSEATWYNMNIRSTKYVHKADSEPYGNNASATTADKAEDAYRWAFSGSPYALVVYNKAAGSASTLTKEGENAVMRDGTYTWTLCQNSDGFTLKVTGTDYTYINDNGSTLKFWNNANAATDDGSTFRVEAVVDNFYSLVESEVLPFLVDGNGNLSPTIGKPFGLTSAAATSIVQTYMTQLNNQQFSLEEYEAILAAKDAGIMYPEAGKFYLVKNNYNGKYMRVAAGATRGQVFADLTAEEAAKDASAHIYVVEIGGKPYMMSQGQYFNWVYGRTNGYEGYTVAAKDKYVHFASVAPGVGAFSLAYGNGEGDYASYLGIGFYTLKDETTGVVAGSPTDQTHELAQWTFEEVTSLTASISAAGYATFYVPFAVTIPAEVSASTATTDGTKLNMSDVGTTIPAGTAVILEGPAGDYTFNIDAANTTAAITSDLVGNYFASTAPVDSYVLQKQGEKVGFFKVAAEKEIKANRAYLSVPTTNPVKEAFYLGDTTTGIENVDANLNVNNGEIFNLAGQRVQKAQRGIYIKNGKKVVVK